MDVSFGPYRLFPAQRLLLEGDTPVRLGSRAFDILTALVERAGEVVGKEELIARAWPNTFVDEANLKIQVSALRRALGDRQGDNRYVVNVVGRGYNFVAPIREEEPPRASPSPTIAPATLHNLPFATTRMIGREEIVTALITHLSRRRLVTVVGPGGIGKTTVALAVAERMIGALSMASGWSIWRRSATRAWCRARWRRCSAWKPVLKTRFPALWPLSETIGCCSCSTIASTSIHAAAGLAAAVLSGIVGRQHPGDKPGAARSGRAEHRLGPLGSPPTSSGLTAAEAAAFPAVQLFVDASRARRRLRVTDANAQSVVGICQRLDGLPPPSSSPPPASRFLGSKALPPA